MDAIVAQDTTPTQALTREQAWADYQAACADWERAYTAYSRRSCELNEHNAALCDAEIRTREAKAQALAAWQATPTQAPCPSWITDMGFDTDPVPASAFEAQDLDCWDTVPAAPHLLTRGCCDACEAVFAIADARQAQRDYERGDVDRAEVLAAQSYAAYRAEVANGGLGSYEYGEGR